VTVPKIALPNGIVLDPDGGWAASAQEYARGKGLDDVRVFFSRDKTGYESYLVVVGEAPEYESPSFEAVAARIDVLAAARAFDVADARKE
jgi:hypothetical protein